MINASRREGMTQSKQVPTYVPLLSLTVLVVLVMLPRLLSAHFGLLDDGLMIRTVRQMDQGNWQIWDTQRAGRFRLFYWIYWWLQYKLFGAQPSGFFLGNTFLLGAIAWLLYRRFLRHLVSPWWSAFAVGLVVLSPPAVESFYTLSKGEPLQLFWILISLELLSKFQREPPGLISGVLVSGAALTLFLSMISKESSVIILPIALGWVIWGWIRTRWKGGDVQLRSRLAYLGAAFAASLLFVGIRTLLVGEGLTGGGLALTYRAFSPAGLVESAFSWAGRILQTTPYLLLALLVLPIKTSGGPDGGPLHAVDSVLWMVGWVAVYLPWTFVVNYYLLPFVAGGAFLTAYSLKRLVRCSTEGEGGSKVLYLAMVLLVGMAVVPSLAVSFSDGGIQLTVDEVNAGILDYVEDELPTNTRLLVNIPDRNEYVFEMSHHLEVFRDRSDIQLDITQFQSDLQEGTRSPIAILNPIVDNQPLITVRMGVHEPTLNQWNRQLMAFMGADYRLDYERTGEFPLLRLNFPSLLCGVLPIGEYCRVKPPSLDARTFRYGWEVYLPDGG